MNRCLMVFLVILGTFSVICLLIALPGLILVGCTAEQQTTPPDDPEVITQVTGVKLESDGCTTNLLVLYQPITDPAPAARSKVRQIITIINIPNGECLYFADVPENQPAYVQVYRSNNCLRDGCCSGSKVKVHLHSFSELH